MTFKQASEKLAEVAGGKYHNMRYSETTTSSGDTESLCEVYIDGLSYYGGATWEQAFDELDKAMNPPAAKPINKNQRPRKDVKE